MNQIKYLQNAYAKSGTIFTNTTLEATLKHCLSLPKNGKKGNYGSIFIYNSDRLGEHLENEHSTGIILIDIDYITKEIAETIYNGFDELTAYWNSLLAIQFSSSYYICPEIKSGLHIYIKSDELTYHEYKKEASVCLGIFSQLVEKILNIDIYSLSTKDKPVLDFHNTSIYQRFNLFYSTFKYNEYATEFNMNQLSFEQLEKLTIKYDIEFDKEITKTITPTLNNIQIGNGGKLKIDRYFHIGKYGGNDIRYRISIIADMIFGDNAKSFCDKFFYCENNKSIYTHYPEGNVLNPLIYKWLVKNNYIIESSQNIINNWIDEYADDIMRFIEVNNYGEIIAPTCSGKTTFINNSLAHYFNAVVIVPFNVTNKLYNNLFEVNADYIGKIPQNKPIVMIWDQAIRHWDDIKDRLILVDEAHTLFFDRNYRDSAIKLINKIKEDEAHVIFITATPAGEKELFGMKQIQYYKKRDTIQLNIKASQNIDWTQYNYIKKCIDNNWYDKIVLLDDSTAKKIYEQFVINGYSEDIAYIRSSTKDSEDFKRLRDNELLEKKLTICTCVAFNGLNFKNENENILVIGSIQQGITTSCEIIQQIGRIRNSKVNAIYFYNPERFYYEDIEVKEIRAQEFNSLVVNGHPDSFLSYDRRYLNNNYVEAIKSIQEYQIKHSQIDVIINELGATGYITGKVEDKVNDSEIVKMNLALKRQESNEMKNDIINGDFLNKEYDKEYQQKWAKEIRYMISNPFYSGITIQSFIDMFDKGHKNKLVDTSINNIKEIIKIITVDEQEYQNTISNINLYASMLSNEIDRKKYITNMKRIKSIRNKYKDKIIIDNGCVVLNDIVKDVIQMEMNNHNKQVENNRINGKKGRQIEINGITYKTIKDAADKLRTSRSQIYRMIGK